jgi:hypothetical protein
MTRIVAGLFDSRGDAERTVEHLVQELGVDPAGVEVYGAGESGGDEAWRHALRSLSKLFMPREDRETFQEGVRRHGVVVVACVVESRADRAMDVFEEYGAADLDARKADWQSAGWAPSQTGGTGHDEDIGFATYGGDAVFGHIPKHHHDNTPAGLLGRLEMAVMQPEPSQARARVRSYVPAPQKS